MSKKEFEFMITCNADCLSGFAIAFTRDKNKAEDLIQETLYKALKNREKYKLNVNIKAWLYTIMRNVFINYYRRQKRHPYVLNDNFDKAPFNKLESAIVDNADGVVRVKDIQVLMHQLPGHFRTPFLLYAEGFKYFEIAQLMGEPLGTIKSRIHFARKFMKGSISQV